MQLHVGYEASALPGGQHGQVAVEQKAKSRLALAQQQPRIQRQQCA